MLTLSIDRLETPSRTQSRVIASLIVMLIVTAVAVFTFLQIDRELKRSKTVESDNRTWVLAQIQVDVQNLQIALMHASARPDPAAMAEVRLAYDILYSRVELARRAPTLDELSLRQSAAWLDLAGEDGLIRRFLPLIDGPEADLLAALPTLTSAAAGIRACLSAK